MNKFDTDFSQGMVHPSFNLSALSLPHPSHPLSHAQDGTRASILLDGRHIQCFSGLMLHAAFFSLT